MNNYLRWGLRLIGPLLLVYILWKSRGDLGDIATALATANLWPILLSLGLMPMFIGVKSWRWNMLMRELDVVPPSLGFSMIIYSVGLFYGNATPGQSGDFLKAWYLTDRGQPLAPTLFSILLDRLFDFMIMAPLALLTLVAFGAVIPRGVDTAAIIAAVVFIGATPLLMARGPRNWGMRLLLPLLPTRLRALVEKWRTQFDSLNLRPGPMVALLGASIGSAASTMLRIYLLFLALDLARVPVLAVIGATALIALLQALPISFAGFGVREAVLIALLGLYGYSQGQALALSALFLLINVEHILVGFALSLRYPLGQKPPTGGVQSSKFKVQSEHEYDSAG